MKKTLLFSLLSISLFFASCAKYMDNPQPQDSTAFVDSALLKMSRVISKERLVGVWMKSQDKAEEGFYLGSDGKLTLQNVYSMKGDRWEFFGSDSLRLLIKGASAPVVRIYTITSLTDSVMTVMPVGSTTEEVYRKKANRHYEFTAQHQEFRGALQSFQTMEHTFEVKTVFDGAITVESQSKNILFRIKKDGDEIMEESQRSWEGTLVPGKYTIATTLNKSEAKRGTPSEYMITVEEKEFEKK